MSHKHTQFRLPFTSPTTNPTNATTMAPSDTRDPFLRIPWAAALLSRPGTITRVPGSRHSKASLEDTLFAETLKTPRTLRSCISFWTKPLESAEKIEEVSTLFTFGDGLNGHPDIMHGGIVASILDEAMGILQSANSERDHLRHVAQGMAQGELPPEGGGSFTAYLNLEYKAPVRTPGSLIVVAKYRKREGRKEWIDAVLKQHQGPGEDYDGEEVVCARAEGLFVQPRPKGSRL
jgi:acyl-coenzyme A thioesterase PaaI-like protein